MQQWRCWKRCLACEYSVRYRGEEGENTSDGPQHRQRRIRGAAGLSDVRILDLRHTFSSGGLLVGEGLASWGNPIPAKPLEHSERGAHPCICAFGRSETQPLRKPLCGRELALEGRHPAYSGRGPRRA